MRTGPGQTARIECSTCGQEVRHITALLNHQLARHRVSPTPLPQRILNVLAEGQERSALRLSLVVGAEMHLLMGVLVELTRQGLVVRRYAQDHRQHYYRAARSPQHK